MDRAGDGAAAEAELRGDAVVVDAAALVRREVPRRAVRPDEDAVLLDDLVAGGRCGHDGTLLADD